MKNNTATLKGFKPTPLKSRSGRPSKNVTGMNSEDKAVCERIGFILQMQGITQKEAAARMGTQQTAISRIINYKNAPSIMMLKRFLQAFNVNPMYILFNDKSSYYNLSEKDKPDLINKVKIQQDLINLRNHLGTILKDIEDQ